MPPRSYYLEPRPDDYKAFARSFFPEEQDACDDFVDRFGLPFIEGSHHLAAYVGVSKSIVDQIVRRPKFHYRTFSIPKGDGTPRKITSPRTYLKVIQWWINDNILSHADFGDVVHGFRAGRSFVSNAKTHHGAKHILNVDIEEFFPSISPEMVEGCFRSFGYGDTGAKLLTALTTYKNSAPTGAPTSPLLGNIVLGPMDKVLEDISSKSGMVYTRYADDLTFSSLEMIDVDFVKVVSEIVAEQGFKLKPKKTRFMGRGDRMEVTGVVINDRVNLPRSWRNYARGYVHRVLSSPEQYKKARSKIAGIYGSLKAVDPEESNRLTRQAREALSLLTQTK